ncbi:hypothetical protein pkur_cds_859 [Pandoravirus kuranda]|uniref:Uncharacterized protein n=1 Tax=Pandoravirus kuranda TaxID=3019033 RepID=A0AA95EHM7_9VIRU|nr:hypothetical protein pkur_cds_859 [Pandoravirus kuranda]
MEQQKNNGIQSPLPPKSTSAEVSVLLGMLSAAGIAEDEFGSPADWAEVECDPIYVPDPTRPRRTFADFDWDAHAPKQ